MQVSLKEVRRQVKLARKKVRSNSSNSIPTDIKGNAFYEDVCEHETHCRAFKDYEAELLKRLDKMEADNG